MGAQSKIYEELKELRRRGDSKTPARLREAVALVVGVGNSPAEQLRWLEIRELAERVFADADKADEWLKRPNSAMGGQVPGELLRDELGAAVVRETLEQIDSGIFT